MPRPAGCPCLKAQAATAKLVLVQREAGTQRPRPQRPIGRQQDDGLTTEGLVDVPHDHIQDVIQAAGRGKVATELVERNCLCLTTSGGIGLFARPGSQGADHQADDEQPDEREEVFRVGRQLKLNRGWTKKKSNARTLSAGRQRSPAHVPGKTAATTTAAR